MGRLKILVNKGFIAVSEGLHAALPGFLQDVCNGINACDKISVAYLQNN